MSVCRGKARFAESYKAFWKAGKIQRKGGPKMRVYRCPVCGGFHLTSQVLKRRKYKA